MNNQNGHTVYLAGGGLSLPWVILEDLSSLEHLELSKTGLSSLPADVFDGLPNLERLDSASNELAQSEAKG